MQGFEVDGTQIVVIYPLDGVVTAIQGYCPHQQIRLADGDFDGDTVLTCMAHQWQFDVTTGKGVNPATCELARYPVRIENDEIHVDVADIEPKYSGV